MKTLNLRDKTYLRFSHPHEGESNENLKFTEHKRYTMTSFFSVVSYCHLSATLQTMSIIVETYKTIEVWFEFLSHF